MSLAYNPFKNYAENLRLILADQNSFTVGLAALYQGGEPWEVLMAKAIYNNASLAQLAFNNAGTGMVVGTVGLELLASNTAPDVRTILSVPTTEDLASANESIATRAPLASPSFTGNVGLPASTSIGNVSATELAYLDGVSGPIQGQLDSKLGAVAAAMTYATIVDAGLLGTPTAPTAAVDTSTTQLATTAFVVGQAGAATPLANGVAAVGASTRYSRQDHVHPTDTSRAPIASPALTGTPTAPTASVDTNTTQIATTAFVVGQGYQKTGATPTTVEVTGTSQALAVNVNYIANNASLVTFTLPAVAALGDFFRVTGNGLGGWRIAQQAGQQIRHSGAATTSGTGGSLSSTGQDDSLLIQCVTANTAFKVISAVGSFTVV